jgi:hypothetical protein
MSAMPALSSQLSNHDPPISVSADELGGARAVEVAALLGDSVISVKHCIDPRSGAVRPATWAVIAAGAACLLAAAIAFAASVAATADNQRRLDAWMRQHRPAHAFRPHRPGAGVEWVVFGGLALGLAGLTLGLARVRRERSDPRYRIGTAPGVEHAVEHAPSAAFPLVAPSGDDFVFNYGAGIDGELVLDGAATPLDGLAALGRSRPSAVIPGAVEVPIPANGRIRARAGLTTFVISAVARPRRHAVPAAALGAGGRRTLSYVAGSLAAHLALVAFLQAIPAEAAGISVILEATEKTATDVTGHANEEAPPEPSDGDDGAGGDQSAAAAMALPEGAAGNPTASSAAGRLQVARVDDRPRLSREAALESVVHQGLLGSQLLVSAVTALAAHDDLSSGFDAANVNGPIYGAGGEGAGNFGGGVQGLDFGGGCRTEPCGTIGTRGRYDTIATGRPAGDHFGFPRGGGPGGPRRTPILPQIGEPVTSGPGYDKTIIRRYIRRSINEIAYCYDKQLLAHPGISGEVAVTFLISSSGTVQSATGRGFNAEVASCIAAAVQRIEFPSPGEGSTVQVNYPFHFRAPEV